MTRQNSLLPYFERKKKVLSNITCSTALDLNHEPYYYFFDWSIAWHRTSTKLTIAYNPNEAWH
jgi:hypothetical protein